MKTKIKIPPTNITTVLSKTEERLHNSLESYLSKGYELAMQTLNSITFCKGNKTIKLSIAKNHD